MASADIAYVTPDLIRWARERSGLSYGEIETSLKITKEQIDEWEAGTSRPPFSKAQELAKKFRVPFGYLFLSKAPASDIPLPDFRGRTIQPTPDFLDLLDEILVMQDWYREYAEQSGAKRVPFIGKFSVNGVPEVAADIRKTLSIDDTLRRRASTWSAYLSVLGSQAEDKGVLVMRSGVVANNPRRKLFVSEFQGFAVSDPLAPVLFVNSSDFKTAQIFTMAHELAHLWIGRSGISSPDPTDLSLASTVESFCNRVAAETLVAQEEFAELCDHKLRSENVERLARHFWVSTLVILRRAYDTRKLSAEEFADLAAQERKKQRDVPASGGDYYRNVVARHGARFTGALLGELKRGNVVYREAARMLGMKVPTLAKMAERYS
jgi:Zn-dependent peptidase ImmA (M78 family)/DNA-binding XRE family transcriptional regulator